MVLVKSGTDNKFCVSIPPIVGPSDKPKETAATLMPNTLPLSAAEYAEVNNASPVLYIIAIPIPCNTLAKTSNRNEFDSTASIVDKKANISPTVNIFFLPLQIGPKTSHLPLPW